MTKRFARLTSSLVLVLGLAAFTGSALAGNGNGNGNDKAAAPAAPAASESVSQASSPGNSASAPGQVKKDQATTGANGGGSADQNAGAQAGMKPTSATAKGNKPTWCSTGGGTGSSATCTASGAGAATAQAAAKADASKRYGNGRTAAQIANSRGAPAGTTVYGPGNSQPHKVAACPRKNNRGGGVDVHAVKSYSSAQCASSTQPTTQTKPNAPGPTANVPGPPAKVTGPPANVPGAAVSSAAAAAAGAAPTAQGNSPQGGVLGVTTSQSQEAGGVLGAIEAVGQGTLPFTGFPLWVAVAAAMAMLLLGLTFRRYGRATV
jgi:hypothetical protein